MTREEIVVLIFKNINILRSELSPGTSTPQTIIWDSVNVVLKSIIQDEYPEILYGTDEYNKLSNLLFKIYGIGTFEPIFLDSFK